MKSRTARNVTCYCVTFVPLNTLGQRETNNCQLSSLKVLYSSDSTMHSAFVCSLQSSDSELTEGCSTFEHSACESESLSAGVPAATASSFFGMVWTERSQAAIGNPWVLQPLSSSLKIKFPI